MAKLLHSPAMLPYELATCVKWTLVIPWKHIVHFTEIDASGSGMLWIGVPKGLYRTMTTWPVSEQEKLSLHMMEVAVGVEVLIAKMSDT
jgi:hypothetical protein